MFYFKSWLGPLSSMFNVQCSMFIEDAIAHPKMTNDDWGQEGVEWIETWPTLQIIWTAPKGWYKRYMMHKKWSKV